MFLNVMLIIFVITMVLFFALSFTKNNIKYARLLGFVAVLLMIVLGVYSLFFRDKVKDTNPVGKIIESTDEVELDSVYSIEGTIDKIYHCSEYTNNKPQDVRILEVNGVVCKLCPCEEEFLSEGEVVKLKGRVTYNGDLIILKGCYVMEVK